MSSLTQQTQLRQELMNVDFLLATQAQIVKDFCHVNSTFLGAFDVEVKNLENLIEQVSQNLLTQMELGERETLQLMYTIDFPEKNFLELVSKPEFILLLSEQIIYREAYKVWLRKNYS